MDFSNLFKHASRASAKPETDEHVSLLERLAKSVRGLQAEEEVARLVQGSKDGTYCIPICADDPRQAALTLAEVLRVRNLVAVGNGMAPMPHQCGLAFDPPDGPGAGAPAHVHEGLFAGATPEAAESLVVGIGLLLNEPLYRRLRAMVLVPFEVERTPAGVVSGYIGAHYGWTDGDEVRVERSTTRFVVEDGKLRTESPVIEIEPEGRASRLIRATFIANAAIAGSHAKMRLG